MNHQAAMRKLKACGAFDVGTSKQGQEIAWAVRDRLPASIPAGTLITLVMDVQQATLEEVQSEKMALDEWEEATADTFEEEITRGSDCDVFIGNENVMLYVKA